MSWASFSRPVLWGYLTVRFFALVEHEPGAIVGFLPLARQKFERPLLRCDRRVEVARLGLRGSERIEKAWIFPLRQLAGAGCEFDRPLAVSKLRFGTGSHEERAGVVRFREAGIEPYDKSVMSLRASQFPERNKTTPRL